MPFPATFDPEALAVMHRALDAAMDVAGSRNLGVDRNVLRKMMALRIMAAVAIGLNDERRLTLLALDSMGQHND